MMRPERQLQTLPSDWMFDPSIEDYDIPLEAGVALPTRRKKLVRKKKSSSIPPWSGWLSIVLALSMFVHELVRKSLSNAIVIIMLVIPPITVLYVIVKLWEHKIKTNVTLGLFYSGFAPGFIMLILIEMVCAITFMSYYCSGGEGCQDTIEQLRDFEGLSAVLYKYAPVRGLLFAFALSFFTAGFLEEGVKLLFVSNAVEFLFSTSSSQQRSYQDASGDQLMVTPESGNMSPMEEHGVDTEATPSGSSSEPLKHPIDFVEPTDIRIAQSVTSRHGIIVYFLAFSLGLATSESMLYVCSFTASPADALRMALLRIIFSLPMHCFCGILTGIGLVERYCGNGMSLFGVLLPAVLLHGFYDFVQIIVPMANVFDLDRANVDLLKHTISLLIILLTLNDLRKRLVTYFHQNVM